MKFQYNWVRCCLLILYFFFHMLPHINVTKEISEFALLCKYIFLSFFFSSLNDTSLFWYPSIRAWFIDISGRCVIEGSRTPSNRWRHKTREKGSIRNYHANLTIAVNISVAIRPGDIKFSMRRNAGCASPSASTACIYRVALRVYVFRCVVSLPRTRPIDDEFYFFPSFCSFDRFFFCGRWREGGIKKVNPCLGFRAIPHARDVNISSFALSSPRRDHHLHSSIPLSLASCAHIAVFPPRNKEDPLSRPSPPPRTLSSILSALPSPPLSGHFIFLPERQPTGDVSNFGDVLHFRRSVVSYYNVNVVRMGNRIHLRSSPSFLIQIKIPRHNQKKIFKWQYCFVNLI